MISQELTWQGLIPDLTPYQANFVSSDTLTPASLSEIQSRLFDSIERFIKENSRTRFMFIKSDDSEHYLATFAEAIRPLLTPFSPINGDYQLTENKLAFKWCPEIEGASQAEQILPVAIGLSRNNCLGISHHHYIQCRVYYITLMVEY